MAVPQNSTVRWFNSKMAGAPILCGQPGSMIDILDACLINGFGTATPDGEKITITGGIATVEFSGGNDFEKHAVIEISGATPTALNDAWRIESATATTFSFACPEIPDGNATGSITVKRSPPGGWEKAYSGANKAAYKAIAPQASGSYFRFDDELAREVKVRGYETMQGIDVGTNPFPTESQVGGSGPMWPKSNATATSPRNWWLIADNLFIYFFPAMSANYPSDYEPFLMGDFIPIGSTDTANAILHANTGNILTYPGHNGFFRATSNHRWTPRDAAGQYQSLSPNFSMKTTDMGNRNFGKYPQPANNGIVVEYPTMIVEPGSGGDFRGILPGLFNPLHSCIPINEQVLENLGADDMTAVVISTETSWSKYSVIIDIKGPWM